MAEVLIFRICQNGDVARAAELSRSIRDHSARTLLSDCQSRVLLGTAHSCDERCKEDA